MGGVPLGVSTSPRRGACQTRLYPTINMTWLKTADVGKKNKKMFSRGVSSEMPCSYNKSVVQSKNGFMSQARTDAMFTFGSVYLHWPVTCMQCRVTTKINMKCCESSLEDILFINNNYILYVVQLSVL